MTKAQIYFIEKLDESKTYEEQFKENPLSIYIHGDGYPNNGGVLTPLWKCVKMFLEIRGYFDEEYLIARVIQHLANKRDLDAWFPQKQVTGIGIVTEKADRNYIYIVTAKEIIYWHRQTPEDIKKQSL